MKSDISMERHIKADLTIITSDAILKYLGIQRRTGTGIG